MAPPPGAGSSTSPCPRPRASSSSSCCCAASGCSPSSTRCGCWPGRAGSAATSAPCRSTPTRAASPISRPGWGPRSRSSCSRCCWSRPRCTSACSAPRRSSREARRPLRGGARPARGSRLPPLLDALYRAQALGADLRHPPLRAAPPDLRELSAPLRGHELPGLLPEQRGGGGGHRPAHPRGLLAGRLFPHPLPLPRARRGGGPNSIDLHVRADHDHHPVLHPGEAARDREHPPGPGALLHHLLPTLLPVGAARLL